MLRAPASAVGPASSAAGPALPPRELLCKSKGPRGDHAGHRMLLPCARDLRRRRRSTAQAAHIPASTRGCVLMLGCCGGGCTTLTHAGAPSSNKLQGVRIAAASGETSSAAAAVCCRARPHAAGEAARTKHAPRRRPGYAPRGRREGRAGLAGWRAGGPRLLRLRRSRSHSRIAPSALCLVAAVAAPGAECSLHASSSRDSAS